MASPLAFPTFRATSAPAPRAKRDESHGPRTAPSALRIPNPKYLFTPLRFASATPQVFVHEGARQALERRFEAAHAGPVVLHISDNVTSMVRIARRGEQLRARVHHMFLDAPPSVQSALVRYVLGSDRDASSAVGRFIAENHHRIRAARSPQSPLKTKGAVHDLFALFRKVNERNFDGTHDALVTWGRGNPTKASAQASRKSIKLGSYSATERLIRVHPALDRPWVPKYFVEFVLFHEMLHHVMPATATGDRRIHPPEFRRRERSFYAYERAFRWEKDHIARLLRALVRTAAPAGRELRGNTRVLPVPMGNRRGDGTAAEDDVLTAVLLAMHRGAPSAMTAPPPEEALFVERLRRRDERAFNELVRLYERRVYGIVFRMMGRRDEAEDVTQEVFVQVFKAIDQFRGDSKLSTWVYRIAVNLCKNRSKYNQRRHQNEQDELEAVAERVPLSQARGVTTGDVGRPDDLYAGHEMERVVQRCISQVEPDFREVLVLRDVEELSYEEIGQITGLAEGTVKSRIFRARAQLKGLVEAALGERLS